MTHLVAPYLSLAARLPPIVHGYELRPDEDGSVTASRARRQREIAEIEISQNLVQNFIGLKTFRL